jgi:hypothetical protein
MNHLVFALIGVGAIWKGLEGIYAIAEQNEDPMNAVFSLVLLVCGGALLKIFWRAVRIELCNAESNVDRE